MHQLRQTAREMGSVKLRAEHGSADALPEPGRHFQKSHGVSVEEHEQPAMKALMLMLVTTAAAATGEAGKMAGKRTMAAKETME